MPKSSPIQTNFSGGELGPLVEGGVDSEKYSTGVEILENYIPTLEGPIVRRPGTKRVASVKDPSKPPRFIPFKISNLEQYILEIGENYIRFFTDEGQLVTSGTSYVLTGVIGLANLYNFGLISTTVAMGPFTASRSTNSTKTLEIQDNINVNVKFSSIVSGTILEIPTHWNHNMIQGIGWEAKGDTLWLMHSSIPTFTLQRFGPQDWDLKYFQTKDGPYLPLNSYNNTADSADIGFTLHWDQFDTPATNEKSRYNLRVFSHSSVKIASISDDGTGRIQIDTRSKHGFNVNQKIWIVGVVGTTEANNGSSYTDSTYSLNPAQTESSLWTVNILTQTSLVLLDSVFSNAYVGSGIIYPAIFKNIDAGRNIGLYVDGQRYYGVIQTGSNVVVPSGGYPHPIKAEIALDIDNSPIPFASTVVNIWQLGAYSRRNGYPSDAAFHQSRLVFNGTPGRPTEFNASATGIYNYFDVNNASSLIVTDKNALQFDLISSSQDYLEWVKSGAHGLYFGSQSAEILVSPSRDGQALTPTNISSEAVTTYGTSGVDPIRSGDAIIYVQNSGRKVRELRFFENLQSHKSLHINQLSDHIGLPSISGLAIQKETYPLIWGYKSDGGLISLSYSREESQAIYGWAKHILGGRSDSSGSAPKIKSMEVIKDPSGKYDQLWMAVHRFINGTSDVVVEYMKEPFRHKDPSQNQRDAYYVDCGATYDSSLVISNITTGSALVTATSHGLSRNDIVLITDVVGLNSSLLDINGIIVGSNLVNNKLFIVGSTTTNNFFLQDFNSSIIATNTYSPYFSGGKARKLVSSIGGLTWLKNEEVDIWGDGGYQGKQTVNSAGVLTLTNPAAVVQVGYEYASRCKTLIKEAGSGTGSAIGMQRRTYNVAFRVRDVIDLSYGGMSFLSMHRANFGNGDEIQGDGSIPLYTGIFRDGIEQDVDFYGQVFFEQKGPGPGMIQSITYMMDENDL